MMEEQINQTIDQLVFFLMFQKYMKDTFIATLIRIFFSQYQCGFRKGFSTQHALLVLIEKMKNAREYSHRFIESFDCICHDLLIAKLHAYGSDRNVLKLIYDYLSDKSQKVKIGFLFSAYLDIISGPSKGSILGSPLFNIDLCDLFLKTAAQTFQSLLMIPVLTIVGLHLMKS